MTNLLFIAGLILHITGIAFAGTYLWLNLFSRRAELSERSREMRKMIWFCLILTIVFTLFSCLLSNVSGLEGSIARAEFLYSMLAISWLVVVALCGIALAFAFVAGGGFRKDLVKALRKLFWIGMVGTVVGMVFAWVL